MSLQLMLKELDDALENLFDAVEPLLTPGFEKYPTDGYQQSFQLVDAPPEDVQQESEQQIVQEPSHTSHNMSFFYPGIEIQRVPAGELGYGVLGRSFPYAGRIQIRSDLYGDEWNEVLTHELTHMFNPHLSEYEVRLATRQKLAFTPKWH